MTGILRSMRRHPLAAFYLLAFALSWSGILVAAGPGIPATPDRFRARLVVVGLAMMPGPSLAALLLTAAVSGTAGLRALAERLLHWRADVRSYALALLAAPLAMTIVPLALSPVFPAFLPRVLTVRGAVPLVAGGIIGGAVVGFCEELGWTALATPRWRMRYGWMETGVVVGLLWGAWHVLVNVWSSGTAAGRLSPWLLAHTLLFSFALLPAYRVLMVRVHERTGSLPLAMLMHASLTAGNMILIPDAPPATLAAWSAVVAATLWLLVAAVIVADRRNADLRRAIILSPG